MAYYLTAPAAPGRSTAARGCRHELVYWSQAAAAQRAEHTTETLLRLPFIDGLEHASTATGAKAPNYPSHNNRMKLMKLLVSKGPSCTLSAWRTGRTFTN
jgi:hypothetical protein